jgi:uncharacterized membrane protein
MADSGERFPGTSCGHRGSQSESSPVAEENARETGDPARRSPPFEFSLSLQTALAIGAGALGVAAYVYVLGGIVMWLRLTAARLPSDSVTAGFQDRQLLAIGLKALIFEALLLALVTGIVLLAWRAARSLQNHLAGRKREQEAIEEEEVDQVREAEEEHPGATLESAVFSIVLRSLSLALGLVSAAADSANASASVQVAGFVVIAAGAFGVGVTLIFRSAPDWVDRLKGNRWVRRLLIAIRVVVTVAIFAVAVFVMAAPLGLTLIVLLVLVQFSEKVVRLGRVVDKRELVAPVLILAAALNVVILPYLATPPVTFDQAELILAEGPAHAGAYIGRSGDGIYLATCIAEKEGKPGTERIHVYPSDQVRQVILGGPRYSFDDGKRPTIWNLASYFVQRDEIEDTSKIELDLRSELPVCGQVSGSAS